MRTLSYLIYLACFVFFYEICSAPKTLLRLEYHAELIASDHATNKNEGTKLSQSLKDGKNLFKAHCASCHHKNMKDKLLGPPLKGAEERWSAYPKSDLFDWIKNAPALKAKNHPKAIEISNYSNIEMTIFPTLTDEEILQLLEWIAFKSQLPD